MTPAELWIEFEAASDRSADERERDLALAWHTVRTWARSHKTRGRETVLEVPPLNTLLEEWRPKTGQSAAQMLSVLSRVGLKGKKRKRKRA